MQIPMKRIVAHTAIMHAFVALLFFIPLFINTAHAGEAEDLFRTFSACDRGFFDKLAAEQDVWARSMVLKADSGVMFPAVTNRLHDGQKVQKFQHPLLVGDVELIGYIDDTYEVNGEGTFFDWGFIAKGATVDIAKKLAPYIVDRDQFLPSTENTWQRGQHWNVGEPVDHWHNGVTPMGHAPEPGTVERVLYVADSDSNMFVAKGEVAVACSVQGAVTPDLLRQLRPDLDAVAIAVAAHPTSVVSTTATMVSAKNGSFKMLLPAGWSLATPQNAGQGVESQITAKRSDNGPFLFVRSVNALDVADWPTYSKQFLAAQNKNLPSNAAIEFRAIKVNGLDALRADFSTVQNGNNLHILITSIKSDKQILYLFAIAPESIFDGNRAEMERLAEAIQF